jgi:hypothetical protein
MFCIRKPGYFILNKSSFFDSWNAVLLRTLRVKTEGKAIPVHQSRHMGEWGWLCPRMQYYFQGWLGLRGQLRAFECWSYKGQYIEILFCIHHSYRKKKSVPKICITCIFRLLSISSYEQRVLGKISRNDGEWIKWEITEVNWIQNTAQQRLFLNKFREKSRFTGQMKDFFFEDTFLSSIDQEVV